MNDSNRNTLPPVLQRYIEAWNRHDGGAIVASFASGGTYTDPMTNGQLAGEAIARHAEGLWQAFPDLRFELDGPILGDASTVSMPWRMMGTNQGPFRGLPPSGKSVSLPGVDLVRTGAAGLESVTGYFDSRAVPEQLGLQVVVQPQSVGPFTFGVSTRVVSGRSSVPAAFSVTSLEPRTAAEVEEIRALGRATLMEMLNMDGFIAATTVTCGNRQMTFAAWERAEHTAQMRTSASHNEAVRRFFGSDLARGGTIANWQATRVMTMQRCPQCEAMVSIERSGGRCRCSAEVSADNYW